MVAALCVRVLVLSLFALWPKVNGLSGEDLSAIRRHHELGQASPRVRAAFSVYPGDVSVSDPSQARPVEGYNQPRSVFSSVPRSHHHEVVYGDVPERPAVLQSKEGMWYFPQLLDSAVETPKPWQQVPKKQMPLPIKEDWWTRFSQQQQSQPHQVNKPKLPPRPMLPGQKSTYPGYKWHPSHPTYPVDKELPPWLKLPGEKLPQQPFQPTYPAQKLVQHPSHPTYPVNKGLPPWLKLPGEKLPQQPFQPTYPAQKPAQHPSHPTYPVDKKQPPQLYSLPTLPDLKLPQQPSHPTYPVDKPAKQQPWFTYPGSLLSSVPRSKDNTWQFDFNIKTEPRTSSVQVIRMNPRRFPGQSLQRPNMESSSSHAEEYVPKVYSAAQGPYVWRQPDHGAQRLHGSSS